MASVLLGVTGSVAAIYTPQLVQALRECGHEVRVVATAAAEYFFDPQVLPAGGLVRDRDEWPGERYQRGDAVLHIELRRWADLLLLAPVDANTLAKLALGLTDNCLTCVYRAWEPERAVVLAPAMNTRMWEHPATRRHLRQIADDCKELCIPLRVVDPISKTLACDDVGIGAMAEHAAILSAVADALSEQE